MYYLKLAINSTISKTNNIKAMPPHRGIVTHHQDQSIMWVSLRIMNASPSNPENPMPEDDSLLMFFYS